MGILNVTPDSFSDGGMFSTRDRATAHAIRMADLGADIIDVGGESTRPGARPVAESIELDRVIPVVEAIRQESDVCISVDTSKAAVMVAAAAAGCDLLNDVRALTAEGALGAAADLGLPVCLMHMQGSPETMQEEPGYSDLMAEIKSFFVDRIACCVAAGIDRDGLILDPGFGFGKTPDHNLMLTNRLAELRSFGLPLLVGLSRKSTISKVAGNDVSMVGSVAGAVVAVTRGANIVRVHDVAETRAAVRVVSAIEKEQLP